MKKLLLLFSVALLSTATASAQSSRLKSITSSDDYIHFEYTYDDKGRFSKVYREDFGGTTYNDTLCYNAKSQIEFDITYQYFEDDDKFKLVSKCCYGYDDNGNVAWRDNYNSFGGSELSQSAHITYDYDADNHMIKQSQYWSFDLDNPFAIIEYTYNEAGQHVSTSEKYADFYNPSSFEKSGKTEYTYNDLGQLVNVKYYSIYQGETTLNNTEEYDYDELGNVKEHRSVAANHVTAKNVYRYDADVPASEVLYPVSNEYNIGLTFELNNKLTEEDVYADANNDGGDDVVYAYTNTYSYEPCGTADVSWVKGHAPFVDVNGKVLNLGGDSNCSVWVYGQGGKLVLSLNAHGTADLSALPAGIYIAKVKEFNGEASYHKFLIK